ncbi:LysR family transcriptional regulator [Mesobacillus sp. AQ2]|jgi:DNA-binding transcriptional LysR family regulator|uniref:LysR family transcriptional regulator n=1 Tax=Bacillaceae TaxID=186817 RepID=UPI0011A0C011|nr:MULTISPECIES: LysR family transcriptional regulator [Bacillaceae]MCM3121772.1 LysR family transcriptional regulator [Mesobacillus sp. MER 33]MCM3231736.1 LysR family transcriptional regulator [Mesobacillus sp. MER 48]WHX38704.1 LysR family transcriptional regulator [Mesobacillus sp. AQ2]
MDIRHLEYFTEVAKHLSFTKASQTLHVTQPSISKAIKNLEGELGVPLFYRSSKQLELTDAGKAVLINAKEVLQAFKNLTLELTDIMELKSGEIRIGIPPIVGAAFFSKFISQYKEKYPLVKITLTEVGTKKIKLGVEEGTLDIGLICTLPAPNSSFEIINVIKDPLMLIVHRDHGLALKKEVHFSELDNEPFILYRKDFTLYDLIIEECSKNHFQPNIVCESSQKDFLLGMVEGKMGIALLPSKICKNISNDEIAVIPLVQSNVNLELGMIWKKNKYLPFTVREFITTSRQYLELES